MIMIDGENLTINDVVSVSRNNAKVALSEKGKKKILESRKNLEKIVSGNRVVYGINTGFGELCSVKIHQSKIEELQKNLVRSHAVGVGNPLSEEIVRAVLLLRANALAKGFSGVRIEIVETLVKMLNKNVIPVIPEKGSVGASGDLAPLAHMALTLIGEGEAFFNRERMKSKDALKKAGIKPLKLKAKEGLALINGTSVMTAVLALSVYDAEKLVKNSEIAGSVSLEALKGTDRSFDKKIMDTRKHKGQEDVAHNLRLLLKNSEIIKSHRNCPKIQDAYTLRCMPQVIGASKDVIDWVKKVVEIEMNSATDNPLIFEKESISSGNFHGQPAALAADFLGIAVSEIGDFSERRTARMLDSKLSNLPSFLTEKSGLNSGFMTTQYTAAALVSENKVLAHPASVDSIPTSANQEDHVSMGTIAARKASEIIRNVEYIVAIEMICAAQGLEFHKPLKPGIGVENAYKTIRKYVKKLDNDKILYPDIEKVAELIRNGEIVRNVEKEIGRMR
ncbi:MAG: histidine ammonia-lyase [Thermoplasmatales archaeon]|nr:histidine ammonia-lyase [Thermoplasmatales archaeon]